MPTSSSRHVDAVSDATEIKIPAGLLLAGLAIIFGYALLVAGPEVAKAIIMLQMVGLMFMIPLGIVACFITAKLLAIDFGEMRSACVKLAATFTFPSAVALLIPAAPIAWLVSVALYIGLLAWLFEMEGWEPVICAIVIWLVRMLAVFLALIAVAGMNG